MKEREISLLDFMEEVLLRWRSLLVWMLAGAAMVGAFGCVRAYLASERQGSASLQARMAEPGYAEMLEEELTEDQIQTVRDVAAYEKIYQDRLSYQEQSALMQADSNQIQKAELTFYVSSDDRRRSSEIIQVYEDIVSGAECVEYVSKQAGGAGEADVSAGISIEREASGEFESPNSFEVKIVHTDKDICRDMAKAVAGFVEKKHGQIEKAMGEHQVMPVNQSFTKGPDTSVWMYQKMGLSDTISMKETLDKYKEAFLEKERQYYECLAGQAEGNPGKETAGGNLADGKGHKKTRVSMKYVALGLALGMFAYVFLFFLSYVLDTRICARDNLQELYGISHFGTIPGQRKPGKLFGFVDRWILCLIKRRRRNFSKEEALRLSVAAVRMAAAKEGIEALCLVGCGLQEGALETCEAVRKDLAQEQIQVEIFNNVLYDADSMCRLKDVKGAVLVERAGSTLYSEILKELELLQWQGVAVLGGIVVE